MADDPRPFGLMHGRLYASVGDTVDAGRAPDRVGLNGVATFSATVQRVVSKAPGAKSIDLPQNIVAQINNGALQWQSVDDVPLIANLDSAGKDLGWQWRVDFSNMTYTDPSSNTARKVTLDGYPVSVKIYDPAAALDQYGQNPTITDLADDAPVLTTSATTLAKGDAGPVTQLIRGTVATTTSLAAVDVQVVPTADPLTKAVNFVLYAGGGGGGGGAGTVTNINDVYPDGSGKINLPPSAIGAATAQDVVTAQSTASNALSTASSAQSAAAAAQATANGVQSGLPSKADRTDLGPLAPKDSPVFTGSPKAPTPATSTNDASVATMASVRAAIAQYAPASSATSNMVLWNATNQTWTQNGVTITVRPSVTGPVLLISTNDPLATKPGWMATGDSWIQHPDATS